MIIKIDKIKNFGIYNDFSWNGELGEFNEKNIIYGWNYSGKTTLSRIFAALRDKKINEKFKESSFKISISVAEQIKEITHNNLEQLPFSVMVFNSDFIKENLRWELDSKLNSIAFDVGENVQLRENIETNNKLIEKIQGSDCTRGLIEKHKPAINDFNQFDKKISDEAKRIKNDIFHSLIEFTKTHFNKVKTTIETDIHNFIIQDSQVEELKKISISMNNKVTIDEINLKLTINPIFDTVKELLKEQPAKSTVIKILEENHELYNWAQQGLYLHEKTNKCAFCHNDIKLSRIEQLNQYFSNSAAKLREKIELSKKDISDEILKVNNIIMPKSKYDFTDKCQDDFQVQIIFLETVRTNYVAALIKLNDQLDKKLFDNIFNQIEPEPFDDKCIKEFETWVHDCNAIIRSHNNTVSNFNKVQLEAREKLKKHFVAAFLIEHDYYIKEKLKNKSERRINKYKDFAEKLKQKNKEYEAKLKSVAAGKEKLNNFINVFLNREDISIDVTADDKFILKRGPEPADNLSEGEKTAISFSYFLVSLESLGFDQMKNTIVFIDDPISSLDSNHISETFSLINAFFFRQGLNPSDPQAYVNYFKQLFISTHNFEFFSFLKDAPRLKKKDTKYFLVKRKDTSGSEIQNLPSSLRNFKSEYVYLFNILYKYYIEGCSDQSENTILLPNAIRRFLEIYTLTKLPGSKDEVDNRIKQLFRETNRLKLLHHFSHFTSLEKISKHDGLLMNLPEAVKELIFFLEQDKEHYESLKSTV